MFGPDWEAGCPSCSMLADHVNGFRAHLEQRDVTLAVVSRAQIEKLEAFRKRMGWNFHWVSSYGNQFNRDYRVSFTKAEKDAKKMEYNFAIGEFPSEEAPGISVFCRDGAGEIFHTYSTYGRGLDPMLGVYQFLDLAPKGRDEDALPWPMAWVRHHDRYEANK
jgi:predicted dithiol-disulfide oxidoreductase (DUF899 family)